MASLERTGGASAPRSAAAMVRVWDPVVRLFHWGVVLGVTLNLFILEDGKTLHRYTGYAIGALLAVRILWGFVGSRHARFADFVPSPRAVVAEVREIAAGKDRRRLGHSPLGALMMLSLMLLLALAVGSGFMMTLDAFWGVKWVEEVHEIIANSIMVLAGLHAAAALAQSYRHHENLVLAMVTGRKKAID